MLEIGRAIRLVRTANGKSLSEVAVASRTSTPFMSLVESGARSPSIETLRRIAKALGVPSEVLIHLSMPTPDLLPVRGNASQSLARSITELAEAETRLKSELKGGRSRRNAHR